MLSFIVPAHNEAVLLPATLRILRGSAATAGEPFEIIVVDDASTDGTADVAAATGARVLSVSNRQIGATRNAGAGVARGDILIFVDADTHVTERTIRQAVEAIRRGAVGGGARMRLEPGSPRWASALFAFMVLVMRMCRWAAGCFVFVRRDAFETIGGFDERYYATEEIVLSRALKRRGRMVIVSEPVRTSARKARLYPMRDLPRLLVQYMLEGRRFVQRRENLHMWYDGRREP